MEEHNARILISCAEQQPPRTRAQERVRGTAKGIIFGLSTSQIPIPETCFQANYKPSHRVYIASLTGNAQAASGK